MTDIRFYHLQQQPLEQALPALLLKCQQAGLRALIKCPDAAIMDTLDRVLWDFHADTFLAHDKDGCKRPAMQPFFLTLENENKNSAEVIVLVDAVDAPELDTYQRCLYMFDGRAEAVVNKARQAWKTFKDMDFEMSYWQQREQGGWEQKA